MTLKETYINLLSKYTHDENIVSTFWEEICINYLSENRFYHNLDHLDHLFIQLFEVKSKIRNWDTIMFTLFYHDIIYSSIKSNNEEKSAELAVSRLSELNVSKALIENCKEQILATKKHDLNPDMDTNYFTDADLSILGKSWDAYSEYYKNVRKEYSIYPDLLYISGRKKVLNHFLEMERIFKTDFFFNSYELQARENLRRELGLLK
jgi:predicted metal-dependent HD superfamily phosphohydrolase